MTHNYLQLLEYEAQALARLLRMAAEKDIDQVLEFCDSNSDNCMALRILACELREDIRTEGEEQRMINREIIESQLPSRESMFNFKG